MGQVEEISVDADRFDAVLSATPGKDPCVAITTLSGQADAGGAYAGAFSLDDCQLVHDGDFTATALAL